MHTKSPICYLLAGMILLCITGCPCAHADITTDLIAHWSFDDSAAIGRDDSGNGRDLTIPGPWQSLTGTFGGAIRIEDYGLITNSGPTPYAPYASTDGMQYPGPQGFSVCFWAQINIGDSPVVRDYWQDVACGDSFTLGYNTDLYGGIGFRVREGYCESEIVAQASSEPYIGRWVHLAGVYDPNGYQIRLYVNGELQNQKPLSGPMRSSNPPFVYVCGTWHNAMAGTVDEVRLYNRALTEADLLVLIEGPVDMAAHWSFDNPEDPGHDDSGNGHNGAVLGPFSVAGLEGRGLSFDGLDDSVEVPYSEGLNTSAGATYAAWIRPDYIPSNGNIIGRSQDVQEPVQLDIGHAGTLNYWDHYFRLSCSAPAPYIWTHVAVTVAPGGLAVLYIDGQAVASAPYPNPQVTNPTSILSIGAIDPFPGDLDEVKVYTRALSASEVRLIANREPLPSGRVLFHSSEDGDAAVYSVRSDGTDLQKLTFGAGNELSPQWSPDYEKFAYTDDTGGTVWIYDWETGDRTMIYDSPGECYRPVWSPDGQTLLLTEIVGGSRIVAIAADGQGTVVQLPLESGYVAYPAWSPTGKAFAHERRNAAGNSASNDIWIYDFSQTGDITAGVDIRITDGAADQSSTKTNPDWGPHGRLVVSWGHNLVTIDGGQPGNIISSPITSLQDSRVTVLTVDGSTALSHEHPSWSPDGSYIAFTLFRSGEKSDLWTIKADGSNARRLTDMSYYEHYPDWGSPAPPPLAYYVNGATGSDDNDGLTPGAAFATIQKGIDTATDGYTIFVYPGTYTEELDFIGKAITVTSIDEPAILRAPGYYAASFYHAEGPISVLSNFIVTDCYAGFFCFYASPSLRNLTVVNNSIGVLANSSADPNITNCIFWNNSDIDLYLCNASYSRMDSLEQSICECITDDPLFADPTNNDYHLKSQAGRYESGDWVFDTVMSPCIDTGNPLAVR